jgi:hypothetical protein
LPRTWTSVAPIVVVAASACTWSAPGGPALTGVAPAEAPNHVEVALSISGRDLEPAVEVDFDDPGASTVDSGFTAALVAGTKRIALTSVRRVSSSELRATLPPGGDPGAYALEVRDPEGRVTRLPAAFLIYVAMPPLARLTVSPGAGTAATTSFTFDASGSADARHPLSGLEFRFDPLGDGSWTAWSGEPTLPWTYPAAGAWTAAVEVRDANGFSAWANVLVVVAAPGLEVAVTTSADEKDPGATPAAPGGSGLSLREAVAWVNGQGNARIISLAAPLTVSMTGPQTYMTLTAPGAAIVAERGVVLDFGGINQSCLTLDGPGQRLVGVTLRGCSGTFVTMAPSSAGSQVAHVTVDVSGTPYWAYGILAQATSVTPSRIGPGNDLSGLWIALKVDGENYEILGNRVHDNSVGAKLAGGPARLWQNDFFGHVSGSSNKGLGVEILVGPGPVEILQNGFHGNAVSGIEAASVGSLTVRGNLFTANGAFGLDASAAGLAHDHDGYFGNGAPVAPGLANGPTDLLVDPLLADPARADFRLMPGSPAIDAGIDLGLDLNGAAAGTFNGAAPDLGGWESP